MTCRNVLLAGLFLAATAGFANAADLPTKAPASTAPLDPPFFIVNNNSIGYSYEFTGTDPGVGETRADALGDIVSAGSGGNVADTAVRCRRPLRP